MQEMYLVFDFFSFPGVDYIAVFPFFPAFPEILENPEKPRKNRFMRLLSGDDIDNSDDI